MNIKTLKDFNIAMYVSGHSEKFRLEVTDRILNKYQVQLDNHNNGTTAFYRTKFERKIYKQAHKIQYHTKTGWHEKFGFRAVLNVPPTPNSQLARMVRDVLSSHPLPRGYKVMVREMNGTSLRNSICNFFNPWPQSNCSRQKCLVCSSSNKITSSNSTGCWTAGVTYRLNCNLCAEQGITAQYEGESSRSCFTRGSKHLKDLETRKTGTPLGDHANLYHPGVNMGQEHISMQCRGTFKQPTQRVALEGLGIEKLIGLQTVQGKEKVVIINSKYNFYQPSTITQHSSKLSLN